MNYSELANEHNKKVNGLAGQLEKINEMLGITQASAKIAIVDDNRIAYYMDDYLTLEQQKAIVDMVGSAINAIKVVREGEFNKLIGAETKEDVKMEDVKSKENHKPTLLDTIDIDKFTKMYENGAPREVIAKTFDVGTTTVLRYANKLGIKRKTVEKEKSKNTAIELTKDIVRSTYTLTDTPIKQVAKELGVTQYELHEFAAKNGLRRPSKKEQEVYRDTEVQKKKLTPSKAN